MLYTWCDVSRQHKAKESTQPVTGKPLGAKGNCLFTGLASYGDMMCDCISMNLWHTEIYTTLQLVMHAYIEA